MTSQINLAMTVIGFSLSTLFIVFVCTRLIWARIQLNASRRALATGSRSDLGILERGLNGLEPLVVANFPIKKYKDLCWSSKENTQIDTVNLALYVFLLLYIIQCMKSFLTMMCTVCLAEYNEEDTLRILPICGHSFHASCIDIWLQKHSTCPVCRISLNELPERKWFQPMFSSAFRSQYSMQSINMHYCPCLSNCHMHSSRSLDNQMPGLAQELQCQTEGASAC